MAAWISALTGVGPAIASGSQVCRGTWADLPIAPPMIRNDMRVAAPAVRRPGAAREIDWMSSVPNCLTIRNRADGKRGVADAGDDERFLGGDDVRAVLIPKPDQQIRAQADALPAKVEEEQVVGEDEGEHRADEQVHIREEAGVAVLVGHRLGGVEMDQEADEGDDEGHYERQGVEVEARGDVQPADVHPGV